MLNPDQEKAKQFVRNWFYSDNLFGIVQGQAGCGKTFMVFDAVKDLVKDALITAPTNQAAKQLELVVGDNDRYRVKTIYSSLKYHLVEREDKKVLIQRGSPDLDVPLIIVDEASMIRADILQSISSVGRKVLFMGHKSQLPPIKEGEQISVFDKCLSPVFEKGWPTYNLTTPVRNTGELFNFCSYLETLIYAEKKPKINWHGYNKDVKHLTKYINSVDGREDYFNQRTKLICWTNNTIDAMNDVIRKAIFGKESSKRFIVGDKLMLTEPSIYIGTLGSTTTKGSVLKKKSKIVNINTNTLVTVVAVHMVTIFKIRCYHLFVYEKDQMLELYVPEDPEEVKKLKRTWEHEIFALDWRKREKAFHDMFIILSIFSTVKYSYAISTYRSQGTTIEKVQVNWNELRYITNPVAKHKHLYVAASRVHKELEIIC